MLKQASKCEHFIPRIGGGAKAEASQEMEGSLLYRGILIQCRQIALFSIEMALFSIERWRAS
jgi:hypothetical protein